IHVSSSLAVWALDNNGCVYVRQGVTRQLPIGTEWNKGVKATQLAVSGKAIWVLTNGEVYQLTTSSPLKSDEGQHYEVLQLDEDWVLL
ncbi:putative WD repeat-containing protein, partial [Daphnia magna]